MALARAASRRLKPSSDPNVIPFIDVLLVLLIIFMVTAPQPTVDLPVDLPRAGQHRGPERPTIVSIREASAGYQVFVDDEPVAPADIGARTLAHALSNNPAMGDEVFAEARVFVRADQSTAYANVVDVMDRLRDARFAKVGIFAETAQP